LLNEGTIKELQEKYEYLNPIFISSFKLIWIEKIKKAIEKELI
jgi:hypothetical protein